MKPVLQAMDLRVDLDGVPDVDGLSFETAGDRVLLLAAPRSLFRAAAGMLVPRRGQILAGGASPFEASRLARMAGAPLDPPLPPHWTTSQYLVWSARLSGQTKADAEARVRDALATLKLDAMAKARLQHVPLAARRAIGVASALVTGATTLLLEDPMQGLPDAAARALARLVVRATEGLRMVTFAGRTSLASPLGMDADEVLILDSSRVLAQGAPAEVAAGDRAYAVRIDGHGATFKDAAERRGVRATGAGQSWVVDLGSSTEAGARVTDLLDAAAAADAVVLELRPLAGALS